MPSFTDFEDANDGDYRYVTTPTVEQVYITDKKDVDDFLSKDKQTITEEVKKIESKPAEDRDGTEALYLRVGKNLTISNNVIDGNEGIFSSIWGLMKRFGELIGRFFKWLGETFFGFGRRSEDNYKKFEGKVANDNFDYDSKHTYPTSASVLLDGSKVKKPGPTMAWVRVECNLINKALTNISKAVTESKSLFDKAQTKSVKASDLEAFKNKISDTLGLNVHEGGDKSSLATKIAGSLYGYMTEDPKTKVLNFVSVPTGRVEFNSDSTFTITRTDMTEFKESLKTNSKLLLDIGELSKKEKNLFNIKINNESDVKGIGHPESFLMVASMKSLLNLITFLKTTLETLQRMDNAIYGIIAKTYK